MGGRGSKPRTTCAIFSSIVTHIEVRFDLRPEHILVPLLLAFGHVLRDVPGYCLAIFPIRF